MTNKLKWRLVKLPTSEEVTKLVNDKIITKEEAREILFSEEIESEKSVEDLKQEIKFLKELVEKLGNQTQIIETIRYIEKPYYNWNWYQPYQVWCGGNSTINGVTCANETAHLATNTANSSNTVNCAFTEIN